MSCNAATCIAAETSCAYLCPFRLAYSCPCRRLLPNAVTLWSWPLYTHSDLLAPSLMCLCRAKGAGGGMLLSGSDLAGLIDDSYSLAEAGAGPITPFLNLLT